MDKFLGKHKRDEKDTVEKIKVNTINLEINIRYRYRYKCKLERFSRL
jgi:hypothetical protein